jgi:hypothetical protein
MIPDLLSIFSKFRQDIKDDYTINANITYLYKLISVKSSDIDQKIRNSVIQSILFQQAILPEIIRIATNVMTEHSLNEQLPDDFMKSCYIHDRPE